jgi:HTH-type transcriptional regulator/antitoxin HigA
MNNTTHRVPGTNKIKPKALVSVRSQRRTMTTKNTRPKIKTKEVYEVTMKEIELLMKKGEKHLSDAERKRLLTLAEAAEQYEDTNEPLPIPTSLPDMIRLKMYQLRLNQNFAARLLGVSDAKFSLIMSGKQKPDIYFVKALHDKLQVDANLILQAI